MKKNLVCIHTGVLFNYKGKLNPIIWKKKDGIGNHAKWNNTGWERQVPHASTSMCNLREKGSLK